MCRTGTAAFCLRESGIGMLFGFGTECGSVFIIKWNTVQKYKSKKNKKWEANFLRNIAVLTAKWQDFVQFSFWKALIGMVLIRFWFGFRSGNGTETFLNSEPKQQLIFYSSTTLLNSNAFCDRTAQCQQQRGMANLKLIGLRLKSVKNIQKITQAVKMVSSTEADSLFLFVLCSRKQ